MTIQIGSVIRNAVVFNIKNWIGGLINSDPQIQFVQGIFTLIGQAAEGMESRT